MKACITAYLKNQLKALFGLDLTCIILQMKIALFIFSQTAGILTI